MVHPSRAERQRMRDFDSNNSSKLDQTRSQLPCTSLSPDLIRIFGSIVEGSGRASGDKRILIGNDHVMASMYLRGSPNLLKYDKIHPFVLRVAMSSPYLDVRGDSVPQEQVLGCGSSAVVLLQEGVAVKIPLRYLWSSESDVKVNLYSVRHEQDIYRRLQSNKDERSRGIVSCIGFSAESTRLAYMANGDLRAYLQKHRPTHELQLAWFRQMALTLCYIHDKRVLVADIATRNFLLDTDLSVKICDFSEASLLPLDSNMETVDDNGYTTQIDIGLLGTVMYEVITGTKCDVDLFEHNSPTDGRAHWPERKSLPSTEGLWLARIVEGCWDGEFRSAHSLLRALDSVDLHRAYRVDQTSTASFLHSIKEYTRDQPVTTIIGVLGLTMFTFMIGRRVFQVS